MAVGNPERLFAATDTDTVRRGLHDLAGDGLIDELRSSVERALHGSDEAARRYVEAYRRLTGRLAERARDGQPAPVLLSVLLHSSAEAPFTPWATRFDLGEAVALHLTDRFRVLAGLPGLDTPVESPRVAVDDLSAQRFVRRVHELLDHPDRERPLPRLMRLFALSKTELGGLFGVSRQAVDGWLRQGVPADRQEKLAALLALADLLERKLKPERVPGVARRPAAAYGGRTMLELIAADRHSELLEKVRASFDWSQAA